MVQNVLKWPAPEVVLCRNCRIFGCLPCTGRSVSCQLKVTFKSAGSFSRMLSTTFLPLLKKSDCMVLGTQTSAMADVQWNRWSQLAPSRMAACLVEPMAPLGGYCLLNKRGSSMHGFATVQIKPIYY